MKRYQHRQFGSFLVVALAIVAIISYAALSLGDLFRPGYAGVIIPGLLLVTALLFSSLLIEVDAKHLSWQFGPGLIRKKIHLDDIEHVEVTRTRFWEGWGIHYTSRGWLYNVSGNQAVLVTTMTGKQFMLGSDEPERLAQVLNAQVP